MRRLADLDSGASEGEGAVAVQLQVDRLGTVIAQVRTDLGNAPEPPIATFAAATSLVDEYRTEVRIRDFTLEVDEPPLIGGTDRGPTPVELVLAALGTCQEIVYATYARVLGIPLDGVAVNAEGRLDLRGFFGVADVPAGFQDVTFTVDIASPADRGGCSPARRGGQRPLPRARHPEAAGRGHRRVSAEWGSAGGLKRSRMMGAPP